MKTLNRLMIIQAATIAAAMALCAGLYPSAAFAAQAAQADVNKIIITLERTITRASELYESGQIRPGQPFVAQISPKTKLSFAHETFKADLKRAFAVYTKLTAFKKKRGATAKANTPPKARRAPEGRIGALMQAEDRTASHDRQPAGKVSPQYDVYADYGATQRARAKREDQSVNADLRAVLSERQAADSHRAQQLQRKQQLQSQAMKWQAELDKQASQSATAAAKWEQEHSFGAYAKRFLGSVLQTTIGSFTTAFLTPVATNLANQAVEQMFPNVNTASLATQAAANATQSAITGAAGATGQAAGQAAVGAVTGPAPATGTATGQAPAQPVNPNDIYIPGF